MNPLEAMDLCLWVTEFSHDIDQWARIELMLGEMDRREEEVYDQHYQEGDSA